MIGSTTPAIILLAGALIIPLLRGKAQVIFTLLLPILGFVNLASLPEGVIASTTLLEYDLIPCSVDALSRAFGYIFHISIFLSGLYLAHSGKTLELAVGTFYAGCAIGVIFAGDMLSFFVFWELLTLPAALLILGGGTERSFNAGLRYVVFHVLGGLVLLAGILLSVSEGSSLAVGSRDLESLSSYLIFFGMGLNAAWPLLHTWLTDSYPKASFGGTVLLSAFTTKTAVYALARTFPGTEMLIWIGAVMVTFPVFFAVLENDLRKVLSFSLINQVGYMMIGIGIGSELAINGVTAHAFCHILYKALLFMTMGAVLHQTGTTKATELGGLYRTMPITCACCIIGALSISGFPLFSGFISKAMVVSAAGEEHMFILWLVLLFASAGVLEHAGIKVPFFAFFSHDSGLRPKEAPKNMLVAMIITAALCLALGLFPSALYSILPYDIEYIPYTFSHVISSLELLIFAILAFAVLVLFGLYPAERRSEILDVDWFYRKICSALVKATVKTSDFINSGTRSLVHGRILPGLTEISQNAPARVALLALTPIWKLSGHSKKEIRSRGQELSSAFSRNALPAGIACSMGVLFVGILFFIR